jgi:hypothetical protein
MVWNKLRTATNSYVSLENGVWEVVYTYHTRVKLGELFPS